VALVFSAFFNMGKKAGALLAGLMFFFAAHLVESSFIPLELYFEHRNYLPAFGLYFSVVSVIAIVIAKLKFKNMAIIILLIAPLTFSVFTYQRAMIWQKMTRIFFYSEIIHPQSARVNEGIAFLYLLINDSNNALRHLDKVTQIEPGQRKPEFYFKYLLAYCQANKTLTEHDYKHKIKIHSLSNDLVTVNYFQLFIETVESGKCSSLDLNRLADDFKVAVSKRTAKYEVGNTSQVNMLMARLFSFLGREEEARRQSELSKIENK
jgi:hypothetical protein